MNTKFVALLSAVCLVGTASLAVPARADDAASNTVKQCFLNMKSVRSFRTKTVIVTPSAPQADEDINVEETEEPRMLYSVTTNISSKYENESITTESAYYYRVNHGPWLMQTRSKESPTKIDKSIAGADGSQIHVQTTIPVHDAPWGSIWKKEYDPHATYTFMRHDILDTIPVDVYSTSGMEDGQQTNTEIWIGVKDHLPHEILTHSVQDDKTDHYTTETLSDFNAPITTTVPDVAPSDPSATVAQPSENH